MGKSSMTEIHMPDRELADLMGKYSLNGSLRNGRAFMEAAMAYFQNRAQQSPADIALAKEKMGLIADGGGDL
jgi:hypothetical protein